MERDNLMAGPPATYLMENEEAAAALRAGASPSEVAARFPAYSAAWAALAEAGRPTESFPIAKRVYVAIDDHAERARERINAALTELYGRRVEAIEAAAVAGTAADCVRELHRVAEAGAELILCTALFDQTEQMEQLAAAVMPKLG